MKQPCPVPFSQAAKKDRTTAIPAGLRCCPVPVQSGRDRESSFQESRKTPVIKKKAMPGCFFRTIFNYTEKKKKIASCFFNAGSNFSFPAAYGPFPCDIPYNSGLVPIVAPGHTDRDYNISIEVFVREEHAAMYRSACLSGTYPRKPDRITPEDLPSLYPAWLPMAAQRERKPSAVSPVVLKARGFPLFVRTHT